MPFSDPQAVQNPTTNLHAVDGWGDAVNGSFNFLRGAKAGCHVTSLTGTAIGTDTVMPWATELYDVNGCHDNVTNNSRITVPSGWAGLWFAGTSMRCTSTSGVSFDVYLVVNGATRIARSTSATLGVAECQHAVDTIYPLAVGDYVEVWVTNGDARSTSVASRFWAHWMASGV